MIETGYPPRLDGRQGWVKTLSPTPTSRFGGRITYLDYAFRC